MTNILVYTIISLLAQVWEKAFGALYKLKRKKKLTIILNFDLKTIFEYLENMI
jgi:hypothetical protein